MYNDELDDLYVVNGRAILIDEYERHNGSKQKSYIEAPEDNGKHTKKMITSTKKAMEETVSVPKVKFGHEEHYEIHEEYCIHLQQLVNQSITMCEINQDVTKCPSCPYRKSRTTRCKVSSASIKSE